MSISPIEDRSLQPDARDRLRQGGQWLTSDLSTGGPAARHQPADHLEQAAALTQYGKISEAIACYQRALKINPRSTDALFGLAVCHQARSDFQSAEARLRDLLSFEPQNAKGAFALGTIRLQQGDAQEAIKWMEQALATAPRWGVLHNNLGKAYLHAGDHERARRAFDTAIRLSPDLAESWFNLAEMDVRCGRRSRAIERYRRALSLDPAMGAAHNNMGNALKDEKRYDEAIAAFRRLLELDPDLPQGHYNLGSAYRLAGNSELAIRHLAKAIKLLPTYAEAWNNLGLTCKNLGDWDRALTYFNRALEIAPDLSVARWNRSFVHFLRGQWQAGWNDFEARFQIPHWRTIYPHRIQGHRWDGTPLPGQTLLVHDEQGLGDTLQFVRCLPWAKARCGRLVLETRSELVSLLENTLGIDEVVVRSADAPPRLPFHRYIPLMSIPRLARLDPRQRHQTAPYIRASRDAIDEWRPHLPATGLRVGIVWAGRPEHANDANRSCSIDLMAPLLQRSQVKYIGLQKGPAAKATGQLKAPNFINYGPRLKSFADTAAILAQLDLLITVDTSVAHLAGAMGRPVWVLIPYIPDWRWETGGIHTPWYPTMQLFRQSQPGIWEDVVSRLGQRIDAWGGDALRNTQG